MEHSVAGQRVRSHWRLFLCSLCLQFFIFVKNFLLLNISAAVPFLLMLGALLALGVLHTLGGISASWFSLIFCLNRNFGKSPVKFLNSEIFTRKLKTRLVKRRLYIRITTDCARQTGASIAVSFWNKNRAQSAVHLLHITTDCAWHKNI